MIVILVENGYGNLSSNLNEAVCILQSANTIGKIMNSIQLFSENSKFNQLYFAEKIELVLHPLLIAEGLNKYIYLQ